MQRGDDPSSRSPRDSGEDTGCTLSDEGHELYPDFDGDSYPNVLEAECYRGRLEDAAAYVAITPTGCWSEFSWGDCQDCDDLDPTIHPEADDPAYDGVDSDCQGDSDNDADGDSNDAIAYGGDDCDDTNWGVQPSSSSWPIVEWCGDGLDNDCDGAVDTEPCGTAGDPSKMRRIDGNPLEEMGYAVAVVDMDADGTNAIFVGAGPSVVAMDASGMRSATIRFARSDIDDVDALVADDFDGDGHPELFADLTGEVYHSALVREETTHTVDAPYLFEWSGSPVGDLTGDGRGDVAARGEVYAGPLTDAAPAVVLLEDGESSYVWFDGVGDVTGDGLDDAFGGYRDHYLIEGPVAGEVEIADVGLLFQWAARADAAGDLNGDGIQDMIVTRSSSALFVKLGGAFASLDSELDAQLAISHFEHCNPNNPVSAGDIDGDDRDELALDCYGVFVLPDEPVGTIEVGDVGIWWSLTGAVRVPFPTLAAGDLDDDGIPDLVMGESQVERDFDDAGAVFILAGSELLGP